MACCFVANQTDVLNFLLLETLACEDKALTEAPDYHFLSRPEKYNEAVRKAGHYIQTLKGRVDRADSYFYGK